MTSIVFPYQLNNKGYELRYALRGVEKHLSGVGEVFIVGDLPDWCKNVIHIPFEQTRGNIKWKERNIFEKVLAACNDERVSDSFLFMNDDHFLMSDYEVPKFPSYWHELLRDNDRHGDYGKTIENTLAFFGFEAGFNAKNYDSHCPALFEKDKFLITGREVWQRPYGAAMKSTYYNLWWPSTAIKYQDIKIRGSAVTYDQIKELIKDRLWFSIGDRALNQDMKKVLNEIYPNRSHYEG